MTCWCTWPKTAENTIKNIISHVLQSWHLSLIEDILPFVTVRSRRLYFHWESGPVLRHEGDVCSRFSLSQTGSPQRTVIHTFWPNFFARWPSRRNPIHFPELGIGSHQRCRPGFEPGSVTWNEKWYSHLIPWLTTEPRSSRIFQTITKTFCGPPVLKDLCGTLVEKLCFIASVTHLKSWCSHISYSY